MNANAAATARPASQGALRNAARSGMRQGLVDLRNSLTGGNLIGYIMMPVLMIVILWLSRNDQLGDTGLTVAHYMLPGLLAGTIVIGGFMGVSGELLTEREDGSLLRMKAIPHGLRGYVIGKTAQHVLLNVCLIAMALVVAVILVPGVVPANPLAWLGLLAFTVLGLVASLPIGVAIGSALRSPVAMMIPMVIVYGLLAISGVFAPISVVPWILGVIAQFFPMYWLGLGMRSVLLPAEAASVEIGESWRTLETLGVLGLWAVAGLVLAPIMLRRMIRGVSGSTIQAARERLLTKGY